jgi:hypothetical protein
VFTLNPLFPVDYLETAMTSYSSNKRSYLNQRLLRAPAGAVVTLGWLKANGISGKLANYYAKSGWLHRVGEGAFTLTSEAPDWPGAVFGLQEKFPSLHPGGRTALELTGFAHFLTLGASYPVHLFGPSGQRLPEWFKQLPWFSRVTHVQTNFLPTPQLGLRDQPIGSLTLRISAPERAILEFLFTLVNESSAYEHASLLFEGLGTLRPDLVQQLLESCTSVKVKRLFLHLAEKHGHPWFKQLDQTHISLGSGKRVFVPGGRLDPKYLITVPAASETPADAP